MGADWKHNAVSLVIGLLIGGFGVATWAPNSLQSGRLSARSGQRNHETSVKVGADGQFDYEKLAAVCLRASGRGGMRSAGAGISNETETAEQRVQKARLEAAITSAEERGIWMRRDAFMAESILRQLPAQSGDELRARIAELAKRADLRVESGAQFPDSEQ